MWWCLIPTAQATPPLAAAMHERFDLLTEARDHVVQGRLDSARKVASLLAEVTNPDGLPKEWTKSLKHLRKESRKTGRAKDLVDAAAGVGRIAQVCGECHASTSGGPQLAEGLDLPSQEWREGQNMVLHEWATDWLWLGLVSSEDAAWQRGAQALLDKPLDLSFQKAKPPTDQPQLEQLIYILAGRAATTAANYRGEVMGQFLATCSECHVTERDAGLPSTP